MNEVQTQTIQALDLDLLKRTIAQGTTDEEFKLFVQVCNRTGLDPFARQIYSVKRYDSKAGKETMSLQVSIDGFRLVAQRSGEYAGQTPVYWCGSDGVWKDVWISKEYPYAAKVGVYRKGFTEALWAVAKFDSYVQTYKKDGKYITSHMWEKMPEVMIAKVAESLALRRAFPQELSGLYTAEEMDQSTNENPPIAQVPQKPKGNVKAAMDAITAVKDKAGLESVIKKIPLSAWTDEELETLRLAVHDRKENLK
jgi:phage recombination protein Bet